MSTFYVKKPSIAVIKYILPAIKEYYFPIAVIKYTIPAINDEFTLIEL
ncbi:hypothetical protein [[Flexibacter] sp. ATCC 35208]|nr:hypothetical protein [[Flexibacter] sp. ATCC 35208]